MCVHVTRDCSVRISFDIITVFFVFKIPTQATVLRYAAVVFSLRVVAAGRSILYQI